MEKYRTDPSFREKYLWNQRLKKTQIKREYILKEIIELENQWPVNTDNIVDCLNERERMILLAGLMLGEGTISLNHMNNWISPVFSISNSDTDIMDLCRSLLPELTIDKMARSKPGQKQVYRSRLMRQKDVIKSLIKIRPFLVGHKRMICDIMVDVIRFRLTQPREERGRKIVPFIDESVAKIRELNKRGL